MQKLDLSKVKYSHNDIRRGVKIPSELTEDLAYETGIHAGDGYLGLFRHRTGISYQISYAGDATEEYEFHKEIIIPLLKRLYNLEFHFQEEHKNTLRTYTRSKAIATFKHHVLGLPNGCKTGVLRVPDLIKYSDIKIKSAFLGGLVDTDFSLVFLCNGKYPKITAGFPAENKKFIEDLLEIFSDVGISAHAYLYNRVDQRYSPIKIYKAYKIDISGKDNLNRWLNIAGFKSSKHKTKLALWQRFGRCQKSTTIAQRKQMLASVAQWYSLT